MKVKVNSSAPVDAIRIRHIGSNSAFVWIKEPVPKPVNDLNLTEMNTMEIEITDMIELAQITSMLEQADKSFREMIGWWK